VGWEVGPGVCLPSWRASKTGADSFLHAATITADLSLVHNIHSNAHDFRAVRWNGCTDPALSAVDMARRVVMRSLAKGLPKRFPVGTRYVVEGRRGAKGQLLVYQRYVEFPDGRRVELSIGPKARLPASARERCPMSRASLGPAMISRR
jgi:hypothetical protein